MAYENHHKQKDKQLIQFKMTDDKNVSYSGTLILKSTNINNTINSFGDYDTEYDQVGAGYYVIAVVLVYGMSIVLLIASHIKRRHAKIVEDKQIDKYLEDFQIVRDKHDRDTYRNLKRTIMKKINYERSKKDMYKNLHASMMPLIAVVIPGGDTEVPNISTYDSDTNLSRIESVSVDSFDQNERTLHTSRRQREYMALSRQASKLSIARSVSSGSHTRTYSLRVPSIHVCNKMEANKTEINYNNFRRLSLRTPSKERISANAEEYIINYQRHKDAMATNLMEKANELANYDGIKCLSSSRKRERASSGNKDPQNVFIVWNSETNNCDAKIVKTNNDSTLSNETEAKSILEGSARKNRKMWALNHTYHAVISPDSGCDTPSNEQNIEGIHDEIDNNTLMNHCNSFPPCSTSKFKDKSLFSMRSERSKMTDCCEDSLIEENELSDKESDSKFDIDRIIPKSPSRPERGYFDSQMSPNEDSFYLKVAANSNYINDKNVQITSL